MHPFFNTPVLHYSITPYITDPLVDQYPLARRFGAGVLAPQKIFSSLIQEGNQR